MERRAISDFLMLIMTACLTGSTPLCSIRLRLPAAGLLYALLFIVPTEVQDHETRI